MKPKAHRGAFYYVEKLGAKYHAWATFPKLGSLAMESTRLEFRTDRAAEVAIKRLIDNRLLEETIKKVKDYD